MRIYALRLKPKEDLKKEIIKFTETNNIAAGIILTCVGSLSNANIRLANEDRSLRFNEKFEIISLTGTLSKDGVHLHISIADCEGRVIGGHLLDECIVYTTAEIVIGEIEDMIFSRRYSSDTGFKELDIAAGESFSGRSPAASSSPSGTSTGPRGCSFNIEKCSS